MRFVPESVDEIDGGRRRARNEHLARHTFDRPFDVEEGRS
jgi:hypothetical protein